MARVRQATRIPVTAGQSEITSHGVRRLVEAGAVDFINYDVSEGGGVTDWRRAAALCQSAGVQMAHHEESQIALQLLAGVPHGTYVECFADPERDPVWQTMWANRPPSRTASWICAKEPGFGSSSTGEMIQRYALRNSVGPQLLFQCVQLCFQLCFSWVSVGLSPICLISFEKVSSAPQDAVVLLRAWWVEVEPRACSRSLTSGSARCARLPADLTADATRRAPGASENGTFAPEARQYLRHRRNLRRSGERCGVLTARPTPFPP